MYLFRCNALAIMSDVTNMRADSNRKLVLMAASDTPLVLNSAMLTAAPTATKVAIPSIVPRKVAAIYGTNGIRRNPPP